jgi:hypothetical protein
MMYHRRQSGMSLLGMLIIAMMVGFFIMCIIRMAPAYIEYMAVRDVVSKVAAEFKREQDTTADIRRKLSTLINTNQIYDLDVREIEIEREDGRTWIDASYEVRIPIAWRIDAILKFDDLRFEAGVPAAE